MVPGAFCVVWFIVISFWGPETVQGDKKPKPLASVAFVPPGVGEPTTREARAPRLAPGVAGAHLFMVS